MKIKSASWLYHIPIFIFLVYCGGPLVVLFLNSVKSNTEIMSKPFSLPSVFRYENFVEAWRIGGYFRAYINSFIASSFTIIIVCIAAGLIAYAMTMLKMPGKNVITLYFLSAVAIPPQLYIVLLFVYWARLNLVDSILGIIIIYSAYFLPVSIFLLRAYFLLISRDSFDAAKIEGCSNLRIFWSIIFPLARSAYIVITVRIAYLTWNEFFFAVIFLKDKIIQTVAIRYLEFTGAYYTNFAYISSAGVITLFPILVFYIFMQKRFIEGIGHGGLK